MSESLVECKICGRYLKWMPTHLRTHRLSTNDYLAKFPNAEVVSTETSKLHSTNLKKLRSDPSFMSKLNCGRVGVGEKISRSNKRFHAAHPEISKAWVESMRPFVLERNRDPVFIEKCVRGMARSEKFKNRPTAQMHTIEAHAKNKAAWTSKRRKDASIRLGKTWDRLKNVMGTRRFEYKGTKFRSKWEILFARWLDHHGVPYQYEPNVLKLYIDGEMVRYLPDFYVPEFACYIEIKSLYGIENQLVDKVSLAMSSGYPVLLLTNADIFSIEKKLNEVTL